MGNEYAVFFKLGLWVCRSILKVGLCVWFYFEGRTMGKQFFLKVGLCVMGMQFFFQGGIMGTLS